jgi:GNAT superfamily N-acetyltransferase
MKVRHAGLDDALQVSDIHRSYVDRWYRRLEAEQFDVPYDALSLGERWGFGGPWMSVETCSIHLNNLLLQHQYPFVAHRGDSLVGEMELFLGNEGAPYGKNLHIGLLYVKKGLTGHGIGKALVDRAFEFAAGQECDTITVASAMANVGFYEKCGFELADNMVELEAITKAYDVDIAPMLPPLNMWSFARGMAMPVGRYQSSAFHIFEQLDVYAIPGFLNVRRERVFARVNGHPSMIAFVRYDTVPASADVHAWSEGGAEALTQAALTLLHNEGIKYANILLTGNDYNAMADGLDAAVKGSRSALSRIMK